MDPHGSFISAWGGLDSRGMRSRRLRRGSRLLAVGVAAAAALALPLRGLAADTITSDIVTHYTVSPNYATDHTLWATADNPDVNCPSPNFVFFCTDIFFSTDSGVTWTAIPKTDNNAEGLGDRPIVLPPAYPTDPSIYEDALHELWRSDDGGNSFHVVVPRADFPAAVPGGAAGKAKIMTVVADDTAFAVYDEATGLVAPGPSIPAGIVSVIQPTFADANTMFVPALTAQEEAGLNSGPTNWPSCLLQGCVNEEILRCTLTACTDVATVDFGVIQVSVSPDYATDHTIAAGLFVSRDSGDTFTRITGVSGLFQSEAFVADAPTGPELVLDTTSGGMPFVADTVTQVVFSGASYTTTSNAAPTYLMQSMAWSPDGHLWNAGNAQNARGPFCSSDDGVTWTSPHC